MRVPQAFAGNVGSRRKQWSLAIANTVTNGSLLRRDTYMIEGFQCLGERSVVSQTGALHTYIHTTNQPTAFNYSP
jgi:hypothetical protein